jgi:chaperonin GroEL
MSTVYAKTKVFIYNGDLYNLKEIITILDYCHSNSDPVLILTTNVDDSVIQMAVENVIANKVKWVFPKLIGTPEQKKAIMDDIAILSGANVFEKGKHQFNVNELDYWLGTIDRVENNDLHLTVVVGDKVNKSDLDRHIGDLKKEITTTSNEMTKMFLNQRINKLQGGVAVIYVGGATDLEIIERKDRVEDAVLAAKSALKEGVVEGGGWALYEAAEELKGDIFVQAFKQVLSHPKELIFANAGIMSANTKQDLHSGVWVTSMYAAGIIDPAIVVREALENAFSVAMIVLLTEAVIYKEYPIISGPPRLNTPAFPQKQ